MLQGLANPLRTLLLLAMVIASSFGHHFVMAGSPAQDHYAVEVAHTSAANHHHAEQADCAAAGQCGTAEPSCCVMGQCLVALAPHVVPEFPAALTQSQPTAAGMVLIANAPALPFRPPAL